MSKMIFIFWQNVVSIHQAAFITALSQEHDVIYIAEKEMNENRRAQGWTIPSMGRAQVWIQPSRDEIKAFLEIKDARHIFTGFNGFPWIYNVFKQAVDMGLDISVFAEPVRFEGMKGAFKILNYISFAAKYGKAIRRIFTTGMMGQRCYERCGFNPASIHQFGYFTTSENDEALSAEQNDVEGKARLIYVGELSERKNIVSVLRQLPSLVDLMERFTIIGNGPLADEVQKLIAPYDNVIYYNKVENKEVKRLMRKHDLLILPSVFDGWGAVVNEALMNGTRVVCSEYCGSAVLLDAKIRGEAFSSTTMSRCLTKWLNKGKLKEMERKEIREWALKNISGEAAARYFAAVFEENKKITPPWMLR